MSNSKQAFWVLFGALSAFIFTIISSMILSRYFSKTDYGTYRQILYVYSALLVVFTLGLPKTYSYFLPRLPLAEAKSAIKKINYILVAAGMCMSLFIFFGADLIAELLKNDNLSKPLKYFSLVPIFLLPTIGLDDILASYKSTQLLAAYNIVTKSVMLACVVIPVVIFKGGVEDAIIGFTLASFFAFLLASFLKNYPIRNTESIATTLTYKEIFDYSIPLFLAGIWGVLITVTDQFFISHYFGKEVFADFANGSLELPFVGMIIAATSIVLAPIYSKKSFDGGEEAKQEIAKLWSSVFSKTIMLTYPLVAFFICFSDPVMVLMYGDSYVNSGEYFQIKLLVNFFILIAYGPLVLSIGGNKYYYRVHMYGALILVLLQAFTVVFVHTAIAVVWVSVVCQIGRIMAMLLYVAKYFNLRVYQLFPFLVIAKVMPCFLILYVLKYTVFAYLLIYEEFIALLISGILYVFVFFVWSYFCKLDYISIIKPLLKKEI